MTKQSGLGDGLLFGGYDLSGDTNSVESGGGPAFLDVTAINVAGRERIGGLRDGHLKWVSYFNPTRAHPVLAALPTTDVQVAYLRGTGLGAPAACLIGKQPSYDGKRDDNGNFKFDLDVQANSYGLEWGIQLTAGVRADTAGTAGAAVDLGAAAAFGGQAYLQVLGVTGTSVTVAVEDSADGSTWAAVTGLTFAAATAVGAQRLATANTATIRRYVRATTSGTFTAAAVNVVLNRNEIAGVTF